MSTDTPEPPGTRSSDEQAVRSLYSELLESWNRRDARGMATLCLDDGALIGFDGSMHDGPETIESEIGRIFADHPTGAYVSSVRSVRFPTPDAAILHAVSALVPQGKSDINPDTNAVQTLVAARAGGAWRIALFQNTPAAYHGRPELSARVTEELREALRSSSTSDAARADA